MGKSKLPGHHDPEKRDYKGEYERYHGKPEQKKRRAQRNTARRKKGLKVGDSREVHHKNGNTEDNSSGNLQVTSRKHNRSLSAKENLTKPKSLKEMRKRAAKRALSK